MAYRLVLLLGLALLVIPGRPASLPLSNNLVISQIYSGGGNSGAPWRHDFIEIFNRGAAAVELAGWSVHYASAAGAGWQKTELAGLLAPGQYYLIQQAAGGANGALLPTPDATGTTAMSSSAGKVALLGPGTTIPSGTACPSGAGVVDFVGYGGSANCHEGPGPAPAPNNANAVRRASGGCTETDNNVADFATGPPAPRNRAAPPTACGEGATAPSGTGAAMPQTVAAGGATLLSVAVKPGANPISAGLTVTADLTSIGGAAAQLFYDDGTHGDAAADDSLFTFRAEVAGSVSDGPRTIPITISDAQSRTGRAEIALTVQTGDFSPAGSVLIFPLYDSDAVDPRRENTQLSLTNTHATQSVVVHLFFVTDDSNAVADAFVCLTPNHTLSFLASDADPGVAGYIVAVAVDRESGCPINFNYLIGDEHLRLASGHTAALSAVAFAALAEFPSRCAAGAATAEIEFDGKSYQAAPRALAVESIASPAEQKATLLVLDRIGGNLLSGPSTLGTVAGLLFDDQENSFSFELSSSRRQLRALLSESFPRTTPRLPTVVPAGRTGWIKLWRVSDGALLGAVIISSPSPEQFSGGRLLRALTLTTAASFTIPVFATGC